MTKMNPALGLASLLGLWTSGLAQGGYPYTIDTVPKESSSGPVKFKKVKVPNEGTIESCAFGDFNADGVLDIVSGNHWFAGPGFQTKRQFRLLSTADRSTPDDMTVTLDVNGDGYADVISGGHNYGAFQYLNPGKDGGTWIRTVIDAARPPDGRVDTVAVKANLAHNLGWHSGGLVDVDGDGKAEELLTTGVRAKEKLTMRWFKVENKEWKTYDTKHKCDQWGSGVGDLNGDGRPDILCPDAWLEAPANPRTGTWKKHPFRANICNIAAEPEPKVKNSAGFTSGHATQIYVHDINKDGLKDLLMSSGHANGILWYQQAKKGDTVTFLERLIDSTWYQSHNLEFKDVDGDGDPDLVSGKRWAGWGPNEKAANNVYWYELTPGAANPWKRHVISYNEKIGMGNKGDLGDFDKDGDLDLVVTSGDAGGTYLFVNQRTAPVLVLPGRGPNPGRMQSAVFRNGGVEFRRLEAAGAVRNLKGRLVRRAEEGRGGVLHGQP